MNIEPDKLLPEMLAAASGVLKKRWPAAQTFAENEFRKLLDEAVHIAQLKTDGQITEDEAAYLMNLQRNSARMELLTLEGLGLIAAEEAINAALAAVRDTINSALGGWKLI